MVNEIVVFKRDNKWYTGTITEGKLRKKKQIKKLADVTSTDDYITLNKWIKANLGDKKMPLDPQKYLNLFNVQSLYLLQKKVGAATNASAKQMWKKFNVQCLKCVKDCKQSYRADIVSCQFKENKG